MDEFERYKARTALLRRQMIKEKRLNVFSKKDLQSGNKNMEMRIPLMDRTNRKRIKGDQKDNSITSSDITSNLFTRRTPNVSIQKNRSYSILELKKLTSGFKPKALFGVSNRFLNFHKEFDTIKLSHIRVEHIQTFQVFSSILTFVSWFKLNKFDYIIHDKNNQLKQNVLKRLVTPHRTKLKPKDDDITKNMFLQKYIRIEYNKDSLSPSHLIIRCKKVGKFMYSVRLKSLIDQEITYCLLIASDTRYDLKNDSLIILDDNHSYLHNIGKSTVKVYSRWHVYTDRPIDPNTVSTNV